MLAISIFAVCLFPLYGFHARVKFLKRHFKNEHKLSLRQKCLKKQRKKHSPNKAATRSSPTYHARRTAT